MEILGYYKRKTDGNEYILYKEKGELCITNGVYIWRNYYRRIEERYLPQLNKVPEINLSKIAEMLNRHHKCAKITKVVNEMKHPELIERETLEECFDEVDVDE